MVHVDTYIGDTLMGSTHRDGGSAQEYVIPDLIGLSRRVPFLYDAALLMAEGDSATVYETIDSMIRRFVPESKKNETQVRYEVKIEQIITKEAKDKKLTKGQARMVAVQTMMQATVKDYEAGKLAGQLTTYPSGLKALILDPGSGAPVKTGETVKAEYFGCLKNGKMFDNSFQRGQPLEFAVGVGQMIPGFDEGITHINHGGKAYFFLPARLAYGDQGTPDGSIPPKSVLVFYVELQ